MQTESHRICGTFLYLSPWVQCFGVLGLNPDLSAQTKRSRSLRSSMRVLSKHKGTTLESGKAVDHSRGNHMKNLHLLLALGLLSRVCAA